MDENLCDLVNDDDTSEMVDIVNTVDQEPNYDCTPERIDNSNTVDQESNYDDIVDNSAEVETIEHSTSFIQDISNSYVILTSTHIFLIEVIYHNHIYMLHSVLSEGSDDIVNSVGQTPVSFF